MSGGDDVCVLTGDRCCLKSFAILGTTVERREGEYDSEGCWIGESDRDPDIGCRRSIRGLEG